MKKFIGIVGTNSQKSTNRQLLQFMQKHFQDVEIELVEIKDIPMFNQDLEQPRAIDELNTKILKADGVIIATPEYDQSITASLKSTLEWLSFKVHPLNEKPVLIVGASYGNLGSGRAQQHLRQILISVGIGANVLNGPEFLLSNSLEAFDNEGNLKDPKTVEFLDYLFKKFTQMVNILQNYQYQEVTA